MAWDVEYTDEFGEWWSSLTEDEQVSVAASLHLLEERGPSLGHPHSSGINGSRHGQITGDKRWYDVTVPVAGRLYDEHLEQIRREGVIDG